MLSIIISATFLPPLFAWTLTSPNLRYLLFGLFISALALFGLKLWRVFSSRSSRYAKCRFDFGEGILTILEQTDNSLVLINNGCRNCWEHGLRYKIMPSSRVSPWALFLRLQVLEKDSSISASTKLHRTDVLLVSSCLSKKSYRAIACSIFRSQQKDTVLK